MAAAAAASAAAVAVAHKSFAALRRAEDKCWSPSVSCKGGNWGGTKVLSVVGRGLSVGSLSGGPSVMDSGGGGSFLFIAVVVSSPPPAGNAANVSLVRESSIGCMGCDQIIMLISYFWFRWWNTCQMCVHTQVLRYVQCVYIHTHFNPYIP